MADIVLKTVEGVSITHKDVNKIRVATADGGTVLFSEGGTSSDCEGKCIAVTASASGQVGMMGYAEAAVDVTAIGVSASVSAEVTE